MTKFEELRQKYPNLIPVEELRANVSIIELALQYGYELQRGKGVSRPVLKHPGYKDTIIIQNPRDAGQQIYQRAGDFTDRGTILDFVRNRLTSVFSQFNHPGQHEFRNITDVLYDYLRIDPQQVRQHRQTEASLPKEPAVKQPFLKEQFDLRPLEPQNYLNERNIAPQVIDRPEFTNKIVTQIAYFNPKTGHTEDYLTVKQHPERNYLQFANVAFPYYNGLSSEVAGLELRNAGNIKLHAPGSDRFSSVFVSNAPPTVERFYVVESAIDALSHLQLRNLRGDERFDSVYFSTGGQLTTQQTDTIARYIGTFPKTDNYTIHLAFDNDVAGTKYDLLFTQQLVASRLPLTPTAGQPGRLSFLLPEGEAHRPVVDDLLKRVDNYNLNVRAQISASETDPLGKKEIQNQLILITHGDPKVSVSIPEFKPALSIVTRSLLELTGLDQRVQVDKAQTKDFNQDLGREVLQAAKFRYGLSDSTGLVLYQGNSATVMNRTLNHLKNQGSSEGSTESFTLKERLPYGFQKTQAELKLVRGEVINDTRSPELDKQLVLERKERGQAQTPTEPPGISPPGAEITDSVKRKR